MATTFSATSLPPIEAAAAQYYEYYGSTLTTNTALKVTVVIMAAVIGALSWCIVKTATAAAHVKPLIVRINDVGRAEAVAYQSFTYQPQAPEIRYFLSQFVTGYYSRNHKTIAQEYANSLFFLDRQLFAMVDGHDRKTQWLAKFLVSQEDDVDVTINNVVIENLNAEPFRARVEFTKVFISSNGAEMKRENWASEFVFHINSDIPNELIQHNPLGLSITYFHEDQAFN